MTAGETAYAAGGAKWAALMRVTAAGSDYTSAPQVVFVDPTGGGTGASATATV